MLRAVPFVVVALLLATVISGLGRWVGPFECWRRISNWQAPSRRSWIMAVLVGLGVLPTVLLLAADRVEDAFGGTPLPSPRRGTVIPLLIIGLWTAVPAVVAAVTYRRRLLGAGMAVALALVSTASVLYAAREVARNPDGQFIRLEYVFDPFWPNVAAVGVFCAAAGIRAFRRRDESLESRY